MSRDGLILLFILLAAGLHGQASLIGSAYYLNSKVETGARVPAPHIQIQADGSNGDYTNTDGGYRLYFSQHHPGGVVALRVGNADRQITDGKGNVLEWVNQTDLETVVLPKKPEDRPVQIIVCPKGYRDQAAQRYYRILKTSSDRALREKEKEFFALQKQQKLDYARIAALSSELEKLQQQNDSVAIYKEAFRIASINQDDASKRVVRYIQLLEEGESVQEARKVLSIEGAAIELQAAVRGFRSAIEELETRAGASEAIYDYQDAMTCYDTILKYVNEMELHPARLGDYYLDAARINLHGLNYDQSLDYFQKANSQFEMIDTNYWKLATSHNLLAILQTNRGKIEEALSSQLEAIRIYEHRQYKPHDVLLALAYLSVSIIYRDRGELNKAMEFQTKALDIQQEVLKPDDSDFALSYSNLALIHMQLGNLDLALSYQQKGVDLQEKILDPKAPILSVSYNNLGVIYQALGQFDSGIGYLQKALDIQQTIFDPPHPELAKTYNNMAIQHIEKRDYPQALDYQQQAIDIYEVLFDSLHPMLATCYNNMALIYLGEKDFPRALEFQQKARDIQERILDANHSSLALTYNNLGMISGHLARYGEALDYAQKAVSIVRASLPGKHPYQEQFKSNWLDLHYNRALADMGRQDYAQALISLDTLTRYFDISKLWNDKGICHYYLGTYDQAIDCYQRALAANPEYRSQNYYNNMGMAYAKSGRLHEARDAFQGFEDLFPDQGRPYRNWTLYYTLTGDFNKAMEQLDKAIALGYDDVDWLINEPELKPLRFRDDFNVIVQQLKERKDK